MAAVNNNQATALQDMLFQIKQQVQNASASRSSDVSGILSEVNEDGCMSVRNDDSNKSNQGMTHGLNAQLLDSIEELGRLVHEKERTFDNDDVECDTIIQSLGNILDSAKKHAADTARDTLARAITQFAKRHGSHEVILNSQGM